MGSKKKKRKVPTALLIVVLLIGAVVAGAFTYFQYIRPVQTVECGEEPGPTAPVVSEAYQTTIRGIRYNAVNTTFSGEKQQVAIGSPSPVTFVSDIFFDPSKPHLVDGKCVTDLSTPITLRLKVTFDIDGKIENLTLRYGGNPPPTLLEGCDCTEAFSTHTAPIAGVRWYLGDSYVLLLVSLN